MRAKLLTVWAILRKPADQRSLKEKVLVSGALSSVDYAASLVFRLGSTLIVTRLLAPEIFGLFAIVITFQTILFMITDFGIRSLIIVSDHAKDPKFLRTCWSVQIVRGFFLWCLVALLAFALYAAQKSGLVPPETVYSEPALPIVLAISGASITIKAFESVNQHVYAKDMRFHRITILNVIMSAINPLIVILIALAHPTIWALVIAGIIANMLVAILSFRLFEGTRMGWCWQREHVSELFKRGRWIMSQSTLTAMTNQADQLILGAFLPPSAFGVYFLARQIFGIIPGLVMKVHQAMGLQIFSELLGKSDNSQLRIRYYHYRIPIDLTTCFLAGIMFAVAPALIDLMYDPRYLLAGEVLQVLVFGLPIIGLGLIRSAFAAQKRFHIMALAGLIQALSIWTGLIVAIIVFEDQAIAFLVVALHRLPEIAFLIVLAHREKWVEFWYEIRFFPVTIIGAVVGWGISELYFSLKA